MGERYGPDDTEDLEERGRMGGFHMSRTELTQEDTSRMIACLDHGYVRLLDYMGDDLKIANAARASFAKSHQHMTPGDVKLLGFLFRNGHLSPFRHCFVTYEVKAPLEVARQWWKYVVGSDHTMDGWNEASRRYVTMEPEFYVPGPDEWRSQPENKKQGSGAPVSRRLGEEATERLLSLIQRGSADYEWALENGIAAEVARLFLPAYGMYVSWQWSASLQSVLHFLGQRLEEDAQKEIQVYAQAVYGLTAPVFPETFKMVFDPPVTP